MSFLYIFGLMFLGIFGAAMLAWTFYRAIAASSVKSTDIYVMPSEGLTEFVEQARKIGFIGDIYIIDGAQDEQAVLLAKKYDNVHLNKDLVKKLDG